MPGVDVNDLDLVERGVFRATVIDQIRFLNETNQSTSSKVMNGEMTGIHRYDLGGEAKGKINGRRRTGRDSRRCTTVARRESIDADLSRFA